MDFPAWLVGQGGKVHSDLDLFHKLENGDRGVVARRDIAEGELLLLLPITCALYIPTAEELAKHPDAFPPAVRHLREAHPGLSPFLATTLVLMSEVTRGSASPWAAYVATLPPSCPDCLLHWGEQEKEELEGTTLEQSGPDPASDAYLRHVAPIVAARPDLWQYAAAAAPTEGGAAAAGAAVEEGGSAVGLQEFLRVAGLVQSRAFHLEAENWVSGAREVSKLEGGATQVFLLPGIDMINHQRDPARRNAHLERLTVAQAAAAGLVALPAEGLQGVDALFVMRADKPIKAGEEVLHTYGNLSDAQLLQTYGFLDSEDDFRQPATGAEAAGTSRPEPKKRGKAGKDAASAGADSSSGGGGYRNPYNAVLVPWTVVEEVCTGLLRSMDQAPPKSLQRAKLEFLAAAGVLQAAAPEATQFVLLAQEPLPDELTTAVQVILMTKDEFQELRREYGGDPTSPAKGKGKRGKEGKAPQRPAVKAGAQAAAGGEAASAALPKLSLGTTLLEEDEEFAEMVCIASLQVLEACMERYPTSVKDDVRLLRGEEYTGRARLAVRVRLGEKDVLQMAKKAVVELMRKLQDGTAGKEGVKEDDSEGASEEEAEDEGEGVETEAAPAAKKRRRGLGAEGSAGGDEGSGGGDGSDDDGDGEEGDGLLMGSDDSEKVGYGAEEYDDGIGEAHDRGKAHEAPKDD